MKSQNTGDSTLTPFVYFVGGVLVYPPNTIYESARDALSEAYSKPLATILQERIRRGFVGGPVAVLPEAWWNHFLLSYLRYFANNFSDPGEMEAQAVTALTIMVSASPREAWPTLIDFILGQMDVLSGWNKCWIREDAERRGVFKGEDGNYYYHDLNGILVQINGAKTLPETHLDFITDHILRGHGCLRQIFNVLSAFAIAHEYAQDPSLFPRSMKAVLVEPRFDSTSHKWQLMQFQRTRSIRWRPLSNFCDPDWLAGDLLGRITDTLDRDVWKDRIEKQKDRPSRLDDDCPRQMDYVLDSSVSIGSDEEIYFSFEGRTFRWVNGTAETKATISVGYKDLNSHREEDELLNRLLSLLVWEHRQPIVKEDGVGGPRRPIPHIWAPRSNFGVRVDPQYLPFRSNALSPEMWLALALYKEGVNSRSVFYRFFSFWKVIEVAIKDKTTRLNWINTTAVLPGVEDQRVTEILKLNPNVAQYLDDSCRNAIAHVFRKPIVNPDDYGDYVRISQDLHVVERLARRAVDEHLSAAAVRP